MHQRVKEILIDLCERAVCERNLWTEVFGGLRRLRDANPNDVDHYQNLCEQNEAVRNKAIPELIDLGYPVYTVMITGCSPSDGPSNYEVEDAVVKKFGDRVLPDSEHSQLFIMTTLADRDEVLAYVREVAGIGDVRLYGGDVYKSEFSAYEDVTPVISGMGNWAAAKKFLEYLEGEEALTQYVSGK